ncbi:amidohydrolase [Vicingaceae bacterium]|nr:amidohydrolase [Vicingaceae bacterium]
MRFLKILSTIYIWSLLSCTNTKEADLIVHNAKIYTVNDAFDIAEAMVITDGKIIAIGPEHEIRNKFNAKKIVDAKKRPIYPGFIDAHCHFINYALSKNKVNLVGTKSFDEVLQKLLIFSKENNQDWIFGSGWDQNDWEDKSFPTRAKLDSLFPNKPVVLTRIDGHAQLVNGEVLRRSNINFKSKIEGGAILQYNSKIKPPDLNSLGLRDSEKNDNNINPLSGILIDKAMNLISYETAPKIANSQLSNYLIEAQNDLFSVGLTTIDEAGLDKETIQLIDSLHQAKLLKVKMYIMASSEEETINHYLNKGIYKTDLLNVCSFKFMADGALGSRGACLIDPYSDVLNNHKGLMLHEKAYFDKYAPLIYDKGFQMNTHCIGDSANRLILEVYAKTLKGVNDKRWRIEHAQIIHPEDFQYFKNFTIIPSIQSTHATSDMYWAEERLGSERIKGAYAYQNLLDQNGIVALGTDFPVEGINPINTFYAAVIRKDNKGFPENGYQMENSLSRKEALKGMTIWAAISNFEENEKGSLEVGKSADFIILNDDIVTTKEENILKVKVLQTFINGENVFSLKK